MTHHIRKLPLLLTLVICAALVAHGPIAQFADYHDFADQSRFIGIPHAGDVLSNLGFGIVALWGMLRLWPQRRHPALHDGRHGYALFLLGLLLTAFGSGYYHLAPDNARLVWDRLPIALACAGLLSAVHAETVGNAHAARDTVLLALLSMLGVAWWRMTDLGGNGDLRLYLLFQVLPLVLIPAWQAIYRAPAADRTAFGVAILLYVAAKFAEMNDHPLLARLGHVSGHTLKHCLATAAAAIIVARLIKRTQNADSICLA
jgi:hypothetical protein